VEAPIYLLTSDGYIEAVRVWLHLFEKYWDPAPPVIVCGFTKPKFQLPRGVEFYSIGKQEDYPVDRWSNALIRVLLELPHDLFILMLEDYWISRPVDVGAVRILTDYCRQFEYVARMDLTGDRKNSGSAKPYGKAGHLDLLISDPESQYHCSLMTAIWRRAHLLKILVENETPWDIEINGTPRLRTLRNYVVVLGTETPPVTHTLGLRSGDSTKILLDEINPHDVDELREAGLLHKWEKGK
jgi:hypothetical protein